LRCRISSPNTSSSAALLNWSLDDVHTLYMCEYYEVLHVRHYIVVPILLHWLPGAVALCRCLSHWYHGVKIFTTLRSATSSSSSTLVQERNPRDRSTRVRH
jgi:hypothetical protein